MPVARQGRMTVIIIPQSGKRSRSFQLTSGVVKLAGGLLLLAITALGGLLYLNKSLRSEIAALQQLKEINELQKAEIQSMTWKVQRTEEKLDLLGRLEDQLRKFTRQTLAPGPETDGAKQIPSTETGRGGPHTEGPAANDLPLLSAFLPEEMKPYIFGRFDPAVPRGEAQKPEETLSMARSTNDRMSEQLKAAQSWEGTLTREQSAIALQLDFAAHRPTGLPVTGARLTDGFGLRWSPFGWGKQFHAGVDLAQDSGRPVAATGSGTIIHAGWKSGGYGNTVMLDHGYGFVTLYAHLQDWDVAVGQSVARGDRIGRVGNTGDSTGPHLHYEVHKDGDPVDPMQYTR